MRRTALSILAAACLFGGAQTALAAGGSYSFSGGTAAEQATVVSALEASSFNWGLLPRPVTISIGAYGTSYSTYGHVFLDATLLDAGPFAWGVVQHEMAHQVDFLLLDDGKRQLLQQKLGAKDWCYEVSGLKHADHGCERFASELAWAYWPSQQNSMRPTANGTESIGMPVAEFRALLAQVLGEPSVAAAPSQAKAFAPKPKRRR